MLTHTPSHTLTHTHEDGQRSAGGAVRRQEAESDRGRASGAQQQQLRRLPGALQVRRRLRVRGEGGQNHSERPVHAQQREKCGILQDGQNIRGKTRIFLNTIRPVSVSMRISPIFKYLNSFSADKPLFFRHKWKICSYCCKLWLILQILKYY